MIQSCEQCFKVWIFLHQVSMSVHSEIIHPFELIVARKYELWGYYCTKLQVWSRATSFSDLFCLLFCIWIPLAVLPRVHYFFPPDFHFSTILQGIPAPCADLTPPALLWMTHTHSPTHCQMQKGGGYFFICRRGTSYRSGKYGRDEFNLSE